MPESVKKIRSKGRFCGIVNLKGVNYKIFSYKNHFALCSDTNRFIRYIKSSTLRRIGLTNIDGKVIYNTSGINF